MTADKGQMVLGCSFCPDVLMIYIDIRIQNARIYQKTYFVKDDFQMEENKHKENFALNLPNTKL